MLMYRSLYSSLFVTSEVRIEGLETLDYLDNLQDRQRFTEQGDAITFESEVSIASLNWNIKDLLLIVRLLILCTCFLWKRWTKYMSVHPPKLQFWIMRRKEHLYCGRMGFLMLVSLAMSICFIGLMYFMLGRSLMINGLKLFYGYNRM